MPCPFVPTRSFARKEALAIAGMAALGALIVVDGTKARAVQAQVHSAAPFSISATPNFEVASVKPGTGCGQGRGGPRFGISTSPVGLSITCQTVDFLIRQAYVANGRDPLFMSARLYNQPIQGSPGWINSERYAIDAKTVGTQSREIMLGPMMQALLEDRFKLKIHRETRTVPIYKLTVAKGGPKLETAKDRSCAPIDVEKTDPPPGTHFCGILIRSLNPAPARAALSGATIADLCRGLSRLMDRDVIDETGIAGLFDFRLEISVADLFPHTGVASSDPDASASAADPSGLSIFGAVQKLGLKLERGSGSEDTFVIDHIEKPSGN